MSHLDLNAIKAGMEEADRQAQAKEMVQAALNASLQGPHTVKRYNLWAWAIGNEGDHKVLLLGLPGGVRLEFPIEAGRARMWAEGLQEPLNEPQGPTTE